VNMDLPRPTRSERSVVTGRHELRIERQLRHLAGGSSVGTPSAATARGAHDKRDGHHRPSRVLRPIVLVDFPFRLMMASFPIASALGVCVTCTRETGIHSCVSRMARSSWLYRELASTSSRVMSRYTSRSRQLMRWTCAGDTRMRLPGSQLAVFKTRCRMAQL